MRSYQLRLISVWLTGVVILGPIYIMLAQQNYFDGEDEIDSSLEDDGPFYLHSPDFFSLHE